MTARPRGDGLFLKLTAVACLMYGLSSGLRGVYGILIGYALLYPDSILTLVFPPISLKAKWFILIFAAIELVTGVLGTADGIAHFAHLGGMVVGGLLMWWWKRSRRLYDRDLWI